MLSRYKITEGAREDFWHRTLSRETFSPVAVVSVDVTVEAGADTVMVGGADPASCDANKVEIEVSVRSTVKIS